MNILNTRKNRNNFVGTFNFIAIIGSFCVSILLSHNIYAQEQKKSYILMRLGISGNKGREKSQTDPLFNKVSNNHKNSAVFESSIGYRIRPNFRASFSFNYISKWQIADQRNLDVSYSNQPNKNHNTYYQAYASSLSTTIMDIMIFIDCLLIA